MDEINEKKIKFQVEEVYDNTISYFLWEEVTVANFGGYDYFDSLLSILLASPIQMREKMHTNHSRAATGSGNYYIHIECKFSFKSPAYHNFYKIHNQRIRKCCFHRSNTREIMAWSESVDTLLANKDGLAAFRTFLKSEFSEENVEFWLACEDFKKTKSTTKIASKAQKIYSDFIQDDAPKEINIDFHTKTHISQNISEPTLSCFDDAQKLIYSLMAKDSFPRFLRSEAYKELVKKQQNRHQKRWLPFL
ncbi:regulator of G-protein signaling 21 [Podargus strigoides]